MEEAQEAEGTIFAKHDVDVDDHADDNDADSIEIETMADDDDEGVPAEFNDEYRA
jgi:hypothetical protein